MSTAAQMKHCRRNERNLMLTVLSECFVVSDMFNLSTFIFKLNTNSMEIKDAFAGTLESGDIMVQLSPAQGEGLEINLNSTVEYQFGDQIRKVIAETLKGLGIENASVKAVDKGALDCTIRARVTAAAVRATGKDVWA
jgi:citrate lyase subunit gamma (acyl carrier protein)